MGCAMPKPLQQIIEEKQNELKRLQLQLEAEQRQARPPVPVSAPVPPPYVFYPPYQVPTYGYAPGFQGQSYTPPPPIPVQARAYHPSAAPHRAPSKPQSAAKVIEYTKRMNRQAGRGDAAGCMKLLGEMIAKRIQPSTVTLNVVLKAYARDHQPLEAERVLNTVGWVSACVCGGRVTLDRWRACTGCPRTRAASTPWCPPTPRRETCRPPTGWRRRSVATAHARLELPPPDTCAGVQPGF